MDNEGSTMLVGKISFTFAFAHLREAHTRSALLAGCRSIGGTDRCTGSVKGKKRNSHFMSGIKIPVVVKTV
jgi:hypothetical protein